LYISFRLRKVLHTYLQNEESRGKIAGTQDYSYIRSVAPEKQIEECKRLIIERLKKSNPKKLLSLIIDKTDYMWFQGDTYLSWYVKGKIAQLSETENEDNNNTIQQINNMLGASIRLDLVFTHLIYLFSLIALILYKNEDNELILLIITILGWVTIHFFIEVQSRYRYPAMPEFTILASFGMYKLSYLLNSLKIRKSQNIKHEVIS